MRKRVVQEFFVDRPREQGDYVGLCVDPVSGSIWVFSTKLIWRLDVVDEVRDVWRVYLESAVLLDENYSWYFDRSAELCAASSDHLDDVMTAKAEFFFSRKKYREAAVVYAKSRKSFEEVALQFLESRERDAMKAYLLEKLRVLRSSGSLETQISCLATWLSEIFLNSICELRESGQTESARKELQTFQLFLRDYAEHFDGPTMYHLMSSHGMVEEMIDFAMIRQDYDHALSQFLTFQRHDRALDLLRKLTADRTYAELFYKFAPLLMERVPGDTVDILIRAERNLDPTRLIPALVRSPSDEDVVRFLESVMRHFERVDPAVRNLLLEYYIKSKDEERTLGFLNAECRRPDFDHKYALRKCLDGGQKRTSIYLYSEMGLYEEAVDVALKVGDVESAVMNADRVDGDDDRKKQLWMKIVKSVSSKSDSLRPVMDIIHRCPLIRIEDVLPCFPAEAKIDEFKDEVSKSLTSYNAEIATLQEEVKKVTDNADIIRQDMKQIRFRYAFASQNQKCALTGQLVQGRPMYVFPCGHACLQDALLDERHVKRPRDARERLARFQDELRKAEMERAERDAARDATATAELDVRVEKLKRQFDDAAAAECPLCGDSMIRLVVVPFVGEDETEAMGRWVV